MRTIGTLSTLLALLLIVAATFVVSQHCYAQQRVDSSDIDNDTLDPRPAWDYTQLRSAALDAFAHHFELFDPVPEPTPDPPKKPKRTRSNEEYRILDLAEFNAISDMHSRKRAEFRYDSTVLAYPVELRLLAWSREWQPCGIPPDSTVAEYPATEIHHRALIWAEITHPVTKQQRWAIMMFSPNPLPDGWTPLFNPASITDRYSPVRVFMNRPRSSDIYEYLDIQKHNGARLYFDFNYKSSDCGNDWCHCGRFIDGDVRDNTWAEVTREAPSRFFPNGK